MKTIELGNIGNGALKEQFNLELEKVIENILDPNTDAKTMRSVTVVLKIKPEPENREACLLESVASSKLAPRKALLSILNVGQGADGAFKAVESIPMQGGLFGVEVDQDQDQIE